GGIAGETGGGPASGGSTLRLGGGGGSSDRPARLAERDPNCAASDVVRVSVLRGQLPVSAYTPGLPGQVPRRAYPESDGSGPARGCVGSAVSPGASLVRGHLVRLRSRRDGPAPLAPPRRFRLIACPAR